MRVTAAAADSGNSRHENTAIMDTDIEARAIEKSESGTTNHEEVNIKINDIEKTNIEQGITDISVITTMFSKLTLANEGTAKESAFFTKLPAEMRNLIYEFALTHPEDVVLPTRRGLYGPESRQLNDRGLMPKTPLLAVCRQIRAEATSIFYHSNTFFCVANAYDSCAVPLAFLQSLAEQERKAMRRLTIRLELPTVTAWWLDELYETPSEKARTQMQSLPPSLRPACFGDSERLSGDARAQIEANCRAWLWKVIQLDHEPCLMPMVEVIRSLPVDMRRCLAFKAEKIDPDFEVDNVAEELRSNYESKVAYIFNHLLEDPKWQMMTRVERFGPKTAEQQYGEDISIMWLSALVQIRFNSVWDAAARHERQGIQEDELESIFSYNDYVRARAVENGIQSGGIDPRLREVSYMVKDHPDLAYAADYVKKRKADFWRESLWSDLPFLRPRD